MTGMYVASNPTALSAQFGLTRNMSALGDVLTRLSTGLRINSAKDDPAGLIASELLKAQITGTAKAITNSQRANSMIATADSSLNQIGVLLNDIKGLVVEAANTGTMTDDQLAANQLQVDAALQSIDRIARTTNYGGKKLLDGSLDFRTAGMSGGLSNVQITSANFGTASAVGVNVNVTRAADYARLISNGTGVAVDTVFDVIGNKGSATVNVGAGSTNDQIADAINRSSDSTGVIAYVEGKAERGSIVLSSAGMNNEIVITALEMGLDAGNYEFRVTRGHENDVRVVQEPSGGKPGIVEITLVEAYEQQYKNFVGLFDITVDTTGRTTPADDFTAINMTRGDSNKVVYASVDRDAATNVIEGKSFYADIQNPADGSHTSALNGWTIVVNNAIATAAGNEVSDLDSKTVYINTASAAGDIQAVLEDALANDLSGGLTPVTVNLTQLNAVGNLNNGERYTFANGATEGEVFITYKEGATANDILALLNKAPNVSATLAKGVDGNTLVPNLLSGPTYVETQSAAGVNKVSRYTSGATAQEVIDLINSKLGDKFMATSLNGGGSGGRVSYMDSAVVWGDINLGNALRFTGMDNGPIVRLTNLGANGEKVANQKLSLSIIHPSEADIKAGIHTPILEIKLATDAQGNSITTAKDIADLFNSLTPEQTMGVSATQLYPPGVDPNGRIFGTDECGKPYVLETCANPINGIVQPTGAPGVCGPHQGDLILLGGNQRIVEDNAVARIDGSSAMTLTPAAAVSGTHAGQGYNGTTILTTVEHTSALNGLTFGFTRDETREGFDEATGTLITFLGSEFDSAAAADQDAWLKIAVDDAIAANWEAIRAFTGATGDAVTIVNTANNGAAALADAATADAPTAAVNAGKTKISGSNEALIAADIIGTRGIGDDDPMMFITAKEKGTQMAGINIHFVNDIHSGLEEYNVAYAAGYAAGAALPELFVEFVTKEDGSRELIVTANLGPLALSQLNAGLLAQALNANTEFQQYFEADARQLAAAAAAGGGNAGSVLFNTDISKPVATTVGGYKIESDPTWSGKTGTSSGIGMFGQADNNERLVIESEELGSDQFVDVRVFKGVLNTVDEWGFSSTYSLGSDMEATINGLRAVARGNNISLNTPELAMSMNVANGVGWSGFTITGGGALFQLGPDVVSQQQIRVGIGSMLTTALGGNSGTLYMLKDGEVASLRSSDAGRKLADKIVMEAISNVANIRGRLGALQKGTLEPNIAALQDSMVALTEANAMITNADFAVESSNLTRLQLLIQAGAQTLAIANQLPQYAASLIR